jgi:hypothetical protein
MDNVQKNNFTYYDAPSSEAFKFYSGWSVKLTHTSICAVNRMREALPQRPLFSSVACA